MTKNSNIYIKKKKKNRKLFSDIFNYSTSIFIIKMNLKKNLKLMLFR